MAIMFLKTLSFLALLFGSYMTIVVLKISLHLERQLVRRR